MKTILRCFILIVSALPSQLSAQLNSPGNSVVNENAVVCPTAMNVLYIGVDNPVQIAVPGISSGQLSVTGCGITHTGGIDYIAKPQKVGLDTVVITVKKGKSQSVYNNVFRVRRIPDPYVYVGKSKGGALQVGEFRACRKLEVGNPDFIFQVPYKIISFEMVFAPRTGNVVTDVSKSNMFTNMMLDIALKARPGDIIVIQSVVIQMPDARNVTLNTSFKIVA